MTGQPAGEKLGRQHDGEPARQNLAERGHDVPQSGPSDADPRVPGPGLLFGSSYRTPSTRWWKGVISILVVLAGVLILTAVGTVGVTVLEVMAGVRDEDAALAGQISMTPALLAATNLSLVAAGVVAIVAHRFIIGVRVGYFSSVQPGFRWRWIGLSAVVIVPLYLGYALLGLLDPAYQEPGFTATTVAFLVVILLTTPLQAAAEEYIFRGVIQRAAGSWFASPIWAFAVGALVSAVFFSLAHLSADPWLIGYYFLFGVGLSLLAQLTGGVESGIVIHAANNVFLLLVAAVAGQMDAGFDRSAGTGGPVLLLPLLLLAIVIAAVAWMARRRQLRRVTI